MLYNTKDSEDKRTSDIRVGSGRPTTSEDTYGAVQNAYDEIERFSPPTLDDVYKQYQASGKPVVSFLRDTYAPPKRALTPEQERQARLSGAITDSLVSLAEMFGHGIGADVRNRDFISNSDLIQRYLDADKERYDQAKRLYDNLMAEGGLRDFQYYLNQAKGDYERQRKTLEARANDARKEYENQLAQERGEKADAMKRARNREDALWKWQNVDKPMMNYKYGLQRSLARDNAKGASNSSSSVRSISGRGVRQLDNGDYVIWVDTNPDKDHNFLKTHTGGFVHEYVLTPYQYELSYIQALQEYGDGNTDFAKYFKHLNINKIQKEWDSYDNGKLIKNKSEVPASDKDELVRCYTQWYHDSRHKLGHFLKNVNTSGNSKEYNWTVIPPYRPGYGPSTGAENNPLGGATRKTEKILNTAREVASVEQREGDRDYTQFFK